VSVTAVPTWIPSPAKVHEAGVNGHIDSGAGPDNPSFGTRQPIRGKTVTCNSDLDWQRVLRMSVIEAGGDGNPVVGLLLENVVCIGHIDPELKDHST